MVIALEKRGKNRRVEAREARTISG